MKKAIVCVLVLILCVTAFVACNKNEEPSEAIQAAKKVVDTLYEDAAVNTAVDYELISTVSGQGKTFSIQWTVNIKSGSADSVKIVESENVGKVKVDVPEYSSEEILYEIVGVIKGEKESLTVTYQRKVPIFAVATWQEYIDACLRADTAETITVKGFVVGVNAAPLSSSKVSLWIMDESGRGYYAYRPKNDLGTSPTREEINAAYPFGTEVTLNGSVYIFNGAYQFRQECTIQKTGRTAEDAGVTLPYVDATDDFAAGTAESLGKHQATLVEVKNVTMGSIDGKNYHFTVGDKDYVCYIDIYLVDDDTCDALKAKWVVGGKADLKGVVNVFGNVYQIYPNSIDSISVINEDLTDEQKVERAKDTLTLNDKYTETFDLPTSTWANVSWAVTSGTGVEIVEGKAVVTQTDADQAVVLTATITSGEATDTKDFNITIGAKANSFITEILKVGAALANKATTTESYMIIGTVTKIDVAYDASFKNVSFTVSDGAGDILVYRYNLEDAESIKVGDFVAITAKIQNYNGTIEAVATFAKIDVTDIKTAADAGVAGTGTETMVYGRISAIGVAYSEQFNNITVTITDGTNSIDCYRLAGGADLEVGMYILVTGTPTAYNGKAQLAAGATYVTSPVYVAPEKTDAEKVADAKDALTISQVATANFVLPVQSEDVTISWVSNNAAIAIEGANATVTRGTDDVVVTLTATLSLNEVSDTKDIEVTVKAEGTTVQTVTVTKTMTELATANGWDTTTTKQTFTLDDVVTVVVNGGSNTGKFYTDHIRVYATDTPAGTLTISVADGYELVSINITCITGTYADLQLEGTSVCNVSTSVSGNSVLLSSVKVGTDGKQVRITAIEVVYQAVA